MIPANRLGLLLLRSDRNQIEEKTDRFETKRILHLIDSRWSLQYPFFHFYAVQKDEILFHFLNCVLCLIDV